MPYGDGTGPNGDGPGTGRGMGPCVPAHGPEIGRRPNAFDNERPADVAEMRVPNVGDDRPFPDQVWLDDE